MTKRPVYSSSLPGSPRRYQKMPRAEKPKAEVKLPKLPDTEQEALHRLILAINWNMENWGTTGQWKRAACHVREELKQLRLAALGL